MAPTKDCMVFDFFAEFSDGVPGVLGVDVGVEGYSCRFAPFFVRKSFYSLI